jgi:Flp pilus assembly protein TadB
MTTALIAAMGFAAGLCLLVSGLRPRPQRLDRALARFDPSTAADTKPVVGPSSGDLDDRVGRWLRQVPAIDRVIARLAADLRLLGRSADQQVAQLVAYGLVGLLWAPVVVAGCVALGVPIPVTVPVWLAFAGATVMVVVPFRHVRKEAATARADFGHALSAFCDVASMALSAGQETHGALFEAAAAGSGPAFDEINNALQTGLLAGHSPAESLRQLGEDLGIDDLVDLGSTIGLADTEGAPVGETIAAKARSIRERLIGDIERAAASATERMTIPGAMLMIGFLWLIAFPALYLIFNEAT